MRALKGNLAVSGPNATGLQMSTSAYGDAIPLIYGYDRITPKLIWVSNFESHDGGSGLFGSGGGQTSYSGNVDMLLGFGPIEGVSDVWFNGTWLYIFSTTYVINMSSVTAGQVVPFTITGNPGQIACIAGVYLSGIPFSETYNDFVYPGQTNSFTLAGNGIVPLYNAQFPAPNNDFWPTLGQPYAKYNPPALGGSGTVTFPHAIATPFSICVIYYYDVHTDFPLPLPDADLTFEWQLGNGSSGQPILYPEFAGVSGENIPFGTSAILPQWNLHAKGMFGIGFPVSQGTGNASLPNTGAVQGQTVAAGDCNPADVCFDLVTSGNHEAGFGLSACWNHGAGFSGVVFDPTGGQNNQFQYSRYGSLAVDESGPVGFLKMRNYCLAYSILISGSLTSQTGCAQVLKELAEVANCAPCFDGAGLDFIPYCEVSNFANGTSFIAPTASGPYLTLSRKHFQTTKKDKGGEQIPKPPVIHQAGVPSDNYNSIAISIKDRTGTTNNNTIVLTDAADVTRQGPMAQGSRSWPWLQNPGMAINAGWAVLRRNIIIERDGKYLFTLPAYFSPLIKLMDLVNLDEPSLGDDLVPVRITKISEDAKEMKLDIEAERFIYGASVPRAPGAGVNGVVGSGGGGGGDGQSNPGSVNAPIFIEAIPSIAATPQIWIGVSGGAPIVNGIVSASRVSGGSGYNAANVTVTGTGTGCTMQAVISGGVIISLLVTSPGSGYTGTPTITIVDPTGSGSGASFTAVIQASIPVSYGGCLVYMSTDAGASYAPVLSIDGNTSVIIGSQTTGKVDTSNYPSHVDPDNADTLHVDLTESGKSLASFTVPQQNSFLSLCFLDGGGTVLGPNGQTLTIPYELVAYGAQSLTGVGKYALAPPIRRGVYNTPVAAHNIGVRFSYVLDGNIFKMSIDSSLIGTTLMFKFLAFNKASTITQGLPSATAYSFTPTGLVGFAQQSYNITPTPTVYQGQTGGFPGVDSGSAGWTLPADVYFPPTTATFSNGKVLTYAARDAGLAVFTVSGGGETAWVTIYDPTQVGEPSGVATLTAFADTNQTRWNTPGYIRIGTIVSKALSGGGGTGGGGGSGTGAGVYILPFFEGDATLVQPQASQVLLSHQIPSSVSNVTLPVGLAGSVAKCAVAPTAAVVITIKQNGASIGTINFAIGATVGTFTFAAQVVLNPRDVLDFVFQATPDATIAGIFWTIVGTRS